MKVFLIGLIVFLSSLGFAEANEVCDVNGDGQVDRLDISLITYSFGQVATFQDPRDVDGNGYININDARGCVLLCTYNRCGLK